MALEPAVDLYGTPKGWEIQIELYLQLLSDLPLDLLVLGVFHAMRNGAFFPKPSEIRAPATEELCRRRRAAMLLDMALKRARPALPDTAPPTDAQKREVDRIVAGLNLRPAARRRVTAADHQSMADELAQFRAKFNETTGEL